MSFFKYHNYNNSDAVINHTYKSNELIIHVGQQNGIGLVNVLDEYGNQVWSKTYTSDANLQFRKVMSFQGGYIILGVENGEFPFLLHITDSGTVLWHKTFHDISVEDNVFIENLHDQYIYFVFHNAGLNESGIMLITYKGEIISQKIILNSQKERYFKVTGLAVYEEEVYLSGNEVIKGVEQGVFIKTLAVLPKGKEAMAVAK